MKNLLKPISLCSLFTFLLFASFGLQTLKAVATPDELSSICPNKNQEPCATAKQMIESAAVIVFGEPLNGDEWTYAANKMLSAPEVGEQKFKDGLKLIDAINYWKSYAASPFAGDGTRTKIVKAAYMEVYGQLPLISENNDWSLKIKEKNAWYTTIVLAEIEKLNKDQVKRKAMIDRVYQVVFGRSADAGNLQYWMPRKEHYRLIVQANRSWLYSDNGKGDLHDTVKRAFINKTNYKTPSETQIKNTAGAFSLKKLIYSEMFK
jgi:hypothetical protein